MAKVLVLQYAPHLEILDKKARMIPLTEHELDLIQSIQKFRGNDFDKGKQLLEDGDPGSAIKYY